MKHFRVTNHGTISMVTPLTPEAKAWVDERVQVPSWAWLGESFSCEPRYVNDLLAGFAQEVLSEEANA